MRQAPLLLILALPGCIDVQPIRVTIGTFPVPVHLSPVTRIGGGPTDLEGSPAVASATGMIEGRHRVEGGASHQELETYHEDTKKIVTRVWDASQRGSLDLDVHVTELSGGAYAVMAGNDEIVNGWLSVSVHAVR